MHKRNLTVLLILFVCSFSFFTPQKSAKAQSLEWSRTYGCWQGYWVEQTFDSGYIIATGCYLIKTDDSGNFQWASCCYSGGVCVQQTSDSGYIVVGEKLIKVNSSGDTIWTKPISGNCVRQTFDGGYIIVGKEIIETVILTKTDSLGYTLWSRSYAYPGFLYDLPLGWSVQQTIDSGYILAGWTGDEISPAMTDMVLIKTDSIGDTLWTRTYGGDAEDRAYSVQQTFDGGYILAGETYSYGGSMPEVYLIKTDSVGMVLWDSTYGYSGGDEGRSVKQTNDSGYIVCGFTQVLDPNETDVYLIKTNATGHTVWSRAYGGEREDYGYSVYQTLDSGFVAAGSYYNYQAVYLIKVAPYLIGDINQDGQIDLADAVYLIKYLFQNGSPLYRLEVGDCNQNSEVNIEDVIYLINYILKDGPPPP